MARDGRDARLALVASRQAGMFARRQALECGFPSATINRRLARGEWAVVHPGVYRAAIAPMDGLAELWAALLAAGPAAIVSHESAALRYGAEGLPAHPVTLTAPHGTHHRIAGAFVHQIDDVSVRHRTDLGGLPITSPARVVVDLGATRDVDTVGRVADDLVRMGRTSYRAIAAVLASVARPGKPGLVTVSRVLDERGDGHVPPQSELERLLFSTLDAGGLPAPVRQLPLPGRGPIRGIADGGYLDTQIVLEADGRRWHDRVAAARQDRARDAQVIAAGWVPLRFVHEQLIEEPQTVVAIVAETRARRLELLHRVA